MQTKRHRGIFVAGAFVASLLCACSQGAEPASTSKEPIPSVSAPNVEPEACTRGCFSCGCPSTGNPCSYYGCQNNGQGYGTCVLEYYGSSTGCSNALNCISAGFCNGEGTCDAYPGDHEVCTITSHGMEDGYGYCTCADYQCCAFGGGGADCPDTIGACTSSWE
jgi:hypothetical protein